MTDKPKEIDLMKAIGESIEKGMPIKLFAKIETPKQADMVWTLMNRQPDAEYIKQFDETFLSFNYEFQWYYDKYFLLAQGYEEKDFDTVVATGLKGQEEAVRGIAEIVGLNVKCEFCRCPVCEEIENE